MKDHNAVLEELSDLYRRMKQGLTPSTAGGGTGEYHPHSKPGSRLPISPSVSDQIQAVDQAVDDVAMRARDLLGFQHQRPPHVTRDRAVWLEFRHACVVRNLPTVDYSTVATLKALSALLEAVPAPDGERFLDRLDELRRETRVTLRLDPEPMRLSAPCPECWGIEIPRVARHTLLANPELGRVWCTNRQCGYLCGSERCWCAAEGGSRHRMVWDRKDLIRLGQLVDLAADLAEQTASLEAAS